MKKIGSDKKGVRTSRQDLGSFGEKLACKWYLDRGYDFVDFNVFIGRIGEIDLIVSRNFKGFTEIVFVEVKTRSSQYYGYGYESIDERKLKKMRRCAMQWMSENSKNFSSKRKWRIDVVSIDKCSDVFEVKVFSSV